MRRIRKTNQLRDLVRETRLSVKDFVYPVFIKEGISKPEPIESMPGQYRLPISNLQNEIDTLVSLNIPGVLIFGIPEKKDALGSSAYHDDGVVQQAIKNIKEANGNKITVFSDVCLCQYLYQRPYIDPTR